MAVVYSSYILKNYWIVKDTIMDYSTLVNKRNKLENEHPTPNLDDDNAQWTFVKCKLQTETGCGSRVVFHLYIAHYCDNIEQFKRRLALLEDVPHLNTEVRRWVGTIMKQPRDQEVYATPTWLHHIVFHIT